jgi:hypothetical protein
MVKTIALLSASLTCRECQIELVAQVLLDEGRVA